MIYVFLADGFEEIEAITVIDILRRAGLETVTVGIGSREIEGAHGIKVTADIPDSAAETTGIDMVVLPGGMPGTRNLERSETVRNTIEYAAANDLYIAAICAAPSIPGHMGLLKGKQAVCYPGYEKDLTGAEIFDEPFTVSGKIITGRSAGHSQAFALKLVEILCGSEKSQEIMALLLCL